MNIEQVSESQTCSVFGHKSHLVYVQSLFWQRLATVVLNPEARASGIRTSSVFGHSLYAYDFFRHAQELHVLPKLKEHLDRFKTVEDFKVLYTVS